MAFALRPVNCFELFVYKNFKHVSSKKSVLLQAKNIKSASLQVCPTSRIKTKMAWQFTLCSCNTLFIH